MGYSENDQGRHSRGFRGARAPLLFCPPGGFLKYIMVLIFPKIFLPIVVHLCYLVVLPKFIQFTNFEKILKAEVIWHWNHIYIFCLGSRNSVENGALFALPQKRNEYIGIFLFHNKVLAPYRKIESMDY